MHHHFGLRDDLGPSRHAGKVMSCIGMISCNRMGVCFTNDMTRLGQHLGKRVHIISIEYTICQLFEFIIEPLACCSITTTEYPGHGSPCATIHGFNNPDFSFVD